MYKLISSEGINPRSYSTRIEELPCIDYVQYEKEEKRDETHSSTYLIIITEGSLYLSYDYFLQQKVDCGKIILLPPGCHYRIRAEISASAFIFRINDWSSLIDNMISIYHSHEPAGFSEKPNILNIKPEIKEYLSFLKINIEKGMGENREFLHLKSQELLHFICTYYSKKELRDFCLPLLTSNTRFQHFILENYQKVKTVKELAKLYKTSYSKFDRKFHDIFGVSAFQWMQQRKLRVLYHEINDTDKPLRLIAKEQQFLSLPQFNDYCKKHFGYPPGKMRRLTTMFYGEKG